MNILSILSFMYITHCIYHYCFTFISHTSIPFYKKSDSINVTPMNITNEFFTSK